MAEKLERQPKSILKPERHFDDPANRPEDGIKWDEMNILATFHPADKDYGHMKVDEPDTPYTNYVEPEEGLEDVDPQSDEDEATLNATEINKKLSSGPPKRWWEDEGDKEESSEDEEEELTEEAKEKQRQFQLKRKQHYNEAFNIKLAKQLIQQELEEDEEDDEEGEAASSKVEVTEGTRGEGRSEEPGCSAHSVDGLSKRMEDTSVGGTGLSAETGD
ncbi:protein phosphatase inhibitor 2-like [Diadema setosum]|uniref:protein phosphatase inhibitor 2-like n=1 Tax=Diadema antillarum TaxID=105358 RepID=UPI003A839B10